MLKKIIVNSGFFICVISFLLYILATIFNCFLVDSNEYLSVANHLNLSDKLNINKEDLTYTINRIFDYVYGKSDNMNLTIKIEDRSVYLFNEKELTHMSDVKKIYNIFLVFNRLFLFIFLLTLLICLKYKIYFKNFKKKFLSLIFSFFCFFLFILIAFLDNFNSSWIFIHKLLFNNNLWILNPYTDRLLILFPSDYFIIIISKTLISFLVLTLFLMLLVILNFRKKNYNN